MHDYFNTLIARADCHSGWSLRPVEGQLVGAGELADLIAAGCDTPHYEFQFEPKGGTAIDFGFRNGSSVTPNSSKYWITQSACSTCGSGLAYLADSFASPQEGAKVTIPAFYQTQMTLAADISSSATTITLAGTTGPTWGTGRGVKIDNEIILLTQTDPSAGPLVNVTRGAFGTTAAAHTTGAAIHTSTNSIGTDNYFVIPIRATGPEETSWLFTWDAWHSETWAGFTGLNPGFKEFQIVNYTDRWYEVQQRFDECNDGGTIVTAPGCTPGTHIGSSGARAYQNLMTPFSQKYPLGPASTPFLLEHSKWIRYWIHVEQQVETDLTNFTNVTTLSGAMDAVTTSMPINHLNLSTGDGPGYTGNSVFHGGYIQPNGTAPGRIAKIDSELVEVTSCPTTGNPRTCTVVRGVHGTAAATHALSADVGLAFDWINVYMADEDTDPVLLYSNIPGYMTMYESTASDRGAFKEFWLEFDTSSSDAFQNRADDGWADLVTYVRNFVLLKNPPADWSSLRVKPIGNGLPPAPAPAPAPESLLTRAFAAVRNFLTL